MQQPRRKITIIGVTTTSNKPPPFVNSTPLPTGNKPPFVNSTPPPARKTPSPPAKGTPMNPALAISIRILLGLIGAAFYLVVSFALILFNAFFYGASTIADNLWKDRPPPGRIARKTMWENRLSWMGFDGLVACIKYIFTGGNTDLFRGFLKAVYKPAARVSKQYWDQEFHRL